MLTIGQLAGYVGVTAKTIRVYHAKGLLPEPERDASGYRRYRAEDAVDLIKIRTLAEAGVPLARIRELRSAGGDEFRRALDRIDTELSARIESLRATQERLRQLADDRRFALPPEVADQLAQLTRFGFSERWVALLHDLWLLVFATQPASARTAFDDQAEILADPAQRALILAYDHAHDLDPADPRVAALADEIVAATHKRYGDDLPAYDPESAIPGLVQGAVNASSPAWRRLDTLIRERLGVRPATPSPRG